MKQVLKNLEETRDFAKTFLENFSNPQGKASVVGLYGDLGAGKTTFTQALAESFGILESVLSPTFVIMKIYELSGQKYKYKWKHLIHIDAYRIEKSQELLYLGWNEIISNSENLVLIEWPEKVSDIMPEHTQILLKTIDENEREVEVKFYNPSKP